MPHVDAAQRKRLPALTPVDCRVQQSALLLCPLPLRCRSWGQPLSCLLQQMLPDQTDAARLCHKLYFVSECVFQVIERAADKAQPSPLKLHQQNGAQHIHIPHSEQLHPVSEPTKPSITLHYATGWRNPSIHGAINGQAWQDFPMIQVPPLCSLLVPTLVHADAR